jgi:hypothetical protein
MYYDYGQVLLLHHRYVEMILLDHPLWGTLASLLVPSQKAMALMQDNCFLIDE